MDLSTLRITAKGRYGLERSTSEDEFFTDPVLNDCINQAHRWFAKAAMCYYIPDFYQPFVVGQSAYSGDARVIEIDTKTVLIQTAAGTFTPLPQRFYHSLVSERGALQALANGTPTAYWTRQGSDNDQSRIIELSPAPSTSTAGAGTTTTEALDTTETGVDLTSVSGLQRGMQITIENEKMLILSISSLTANVIRGHAGTTAAAHNSGVAVSWNLHNLIYGAWVYPPAMSADTDRPALPAAEHDLLLPAICWKMAEADRDRGRPDADGLIAYWQGQAVDSALELYETFRRNREPQRTASVGASPLADAERRRAPNVGAAQRSG